MGQIAADNFISGGRGSPNAWSPASDGNNWTVDSGAGTLSVVSSQGKITGVTALTFVRLGSTTSVDFDVTARVSVNSSNFTAAGIIARQTATNTAYRARLSSSANTFGIVKTVAGTSTNLSIPAFTVALNTEYWIRFKGIGSNLFAMIWADGSTVPTSWFATATDTGITAAGNVGVNVNTSNSADIALFDNFYAADYSNYEIQSLSTFAADATASSINSVTTTITEQLTTFSAETSISGSQTITSQLSTFSAEATSTASIGFPSTPGVSVLVGSAPVMSNVMIREGSFEIDDSINQASTLSATIRDDSGTNHYKKGQQVLVNDHLYGRMFSGIINDAQEQNVRPNALIFSQVNAVDNHYFPAKRTYIGPEYSNQYAGAIATDLLNVLTSEGITAQYASRRETTQGQFALGTLSNTVATTNDQGDGDLELSLAGVAYAKTETTTSDFATGSTLVNLVAASNALQINPLTALRLRGTAASSVGDCYSYRKIWNGSITINSGDSLAYSIWISSTSPESKAGVQIYCSDGTNFNGISSVADQYNIFATPQSDLSLFAQDQWMDRSIDLTPLAGKTIKSVAVALEGNQSGTYNVYFRNIQLLDSLLSARQTFFQSTRQMDLQVSNVGYKSVSTAVVSVSSQSGYRLSPAYDISSVGIVRSSLISWVSITQTQTGNNTSQQVTISTSIDGGATWQVCTNHQQIPNLTPGMNAGTLMVREDLNVGGPNPELTPFLNELTFSVQPSYATSKVDARHTDTTTADFSAGTITNLTAANNSLAITGQFRAWDDGSLASQTLYGTGNPAHFDSYGTLALRCDNTAEARSRFDFAGQWQNFVLELDIQIVDNTGNYGVVYRTTGWINANDTYAYNAFISATAITLGKGTNGGASTFTSLGTVTVALSTNAWYRLKLVVSGNSHQVYLDDVLYISITDSSFTSAGYVGARHFNNSGGRHSAFFDNFGIMATSLQGVRTATALTNGALSPVGTVGTSLVEWNSDEPGNTALLVEASTDGGSTWSTCTNGGVIPGLTTGTSIGSKSLQLRETFTTANANSTPILYGITALVIGQFSASGTRISPALSLINVGRLGNSLVAWNANIPTGTTLAVATSIDSGSSWQAVTNGGSISGLTGQPDITVDSFDSDTSANYTSTSASYALRAFTAPVPLQANWTWDTAHSRISATTGTRSILLRNGITTADIDITVDIDQSDAGGIVFRAVNATNFYLLRVQDASSPVPNVAQLYKMTNAVLSTIGSAATISHTRGMPHRYRVTMVGNVMTVYMDGTQILTYTDGSALGSGRAGLYNDVLSGAASSRYYNLFIQPLGQDVTAVSVLPKLTLTSTDPTVTPQVTGLTVAAHGSTIGNGALIPGTQYNFNDLASNFDDLVKQSSTATGSQWWWNIDKFKVFYFLSRMALPSPWIATDNPGDFLLDVKVTNQSDLYRNRQIIKNVVANVAIDEKHAGDDVSQSWTLGYALASAPTITVNNVAASVGVKGTDSGKDFYYAVGDPVVTQDSAAAVLTSDQTILIVGTGQYTDYSQYDDTAEQAALALIEGGSGIVENVEDGNGISKAAGDQLAQARVKQYSVRGRVLEATTRRQGLAPGQLLSVWLPEFGVNDGLFLIRSVKTHLTTEYDPLQGAMAQKGWFQIEGIEGADLGDWIKLFEK